MQAPDYSAFTMLGRHAPQPQAAFAALCDLTLALVGVKLFTVMAL